MKKLTQPFYLFFISISLLTLSVHAPADWPKAVKSAVQNSATTNIFPDPFVSSLWSGAQLRKQKLDKKLPIQTLKMKVANFKKPLEVLVARQSRPAPLLIYLQGMFTTCKKTKAHSIAETFFKKGYSVLMIPNSWSVDYISSASKGELPGDVVREAEVVLLLADEFKKAYQDPAYVTSYHIVGESYGAFLAMVVASIDAQRLIPFFDKPLVATLLSPPLDLSLGMKRIDLSISTTISEYNAGCALDAANFISLWNVSKEYKNVTHQSQLSSKAIRCARPIVLHMGFHKWITKAYQAYLKREGRFDEIPHPHYRIREYEEWKENLRLSNFTRTQVPDVFRYQREGLDVLGEWIKRAKHSFSEAKIDFSLRILASQDDFLNEPDQWESLDQKVISDDELILLQHGGHLGYQGLSFYQDIIIQGSF